MLRHMDTSRSTYSHAKRDRTENGYEYLTNGQKFIWSKLGFLYLFVKPRKTNKKTPKKKPIVEQRDSDESSSSDSDTDSSNFLRELLNQNLQMSEGAATKEHKEEADSSDVGESPTSQVEGEETRQSCLSCQVMSESGMSVNRDTNEPQPEHPTD